MKKLNFSEFFRDVHGYTPLPWQERLAEKLINDHTWPDLIDLPTASGKTACIDIALFHLAWCAERGESWRAARRIIFVVDRRIIVDAAAERADVLRYHLTNPRTEAVQRVSNALARLGGASPLVCEKLRGGMPRERTLAMNPVQPAIITSTVDQIGSRLLFRGYGLSPYSYSIHAGLLAFDSLLLVDEAHLSQPFIETMTAIRRYQLQAPEFIGRVQPLRLVPLSATARSEGTKFQLDAKDHENKYLNERRLSPKPARLVEAAMKFSDRLKALLSETVTLAREIESSAPAIAVVVNRVRTARVLFEALATNKIASAFDIELMIGRSRPIDRDVVSKRIIESVGSHRPGIRERGVIVVATQTIEVGADLDFQGLVTECAALDALRQRFGRLDRLGRFGKARAVIVGSSEAEDDAVYGAALRNTWLWLNDVASVENAALTVDFSIDSIDKLTHAMDLSALVSPTRGKLVLTPLHVDLLCQTSPMPMYSPDVPALLHGLGTAAPDVQVLWRADLPLTADHALLDESRLSVARTLLDLNPPTSLESISLPIASVRSWLLGTSSDNTELVDIEGAIEDAPERDAKGARWVLRRDASAQERWTKAYAKDIRPGDTIVAPTVFGGCDDFGFAPSDTSPVKDLSATARERLKKSAQVVITEEWIARLGADSETARQVWMAVCEDLSQETAPRDVFLRLVSSLQDFLPESLSWLASDPVIDVVENPDGSPFALVLTESQVQIGEISDEDISSSYTVPVALGEHNSGVASHARSLAETLALNPHHVEHVSVAGLLHDVGKADPRFQQILRSGAGEVLPGTLLAKGLRASLPARRESVERHEAYSVALVDKYPDLLASVRDRELVRYLIGVHHGRGRALMPDRRDDGTAFEIEIAGKRYPYDGSPMLGSLQSAWSSLFWRLNYRYGPWALAYLESIVRLADWLRSAEELTKGESR